MWIEHRGNCSSSAVKCVTKDWQPIQGSTFQSLSAGTDWLTVKCQPEKMQVIVFFLNTNNPVVFSQLSPLSETCGCPVLSRLWKVFWSNGRIRPQSCLSVILLSSGNLRLVHPSAAGPQWTALPPPLSYKVQLGIFSYIKNYFLNYPFRKIFN